MLAHGREGRCCRLLVRAFRESMCVPVEKEFCFGSDELGRFARNLPILPGVGDRELERWRRSIFSLPCDSIGARVPNFQDGQGLWRGPDDGSDDDGVREGTRRAVVHVGNYDCRLFGCRVRVREGRRDGRLLSVSATHVLVGGCHDDDGGLRRHVPHDGVGEGGGRRHHVLRHDRTRASDYRHRAKFLETVRIERVPAGRHPRVL
mmetsp:Transcript_72933/g.193825  ORF Transcript_72933/g.193825 Transcript_72933/m.193825 type:complete len:205 (+) Transcript_72933:315-929(+)